MSYANTDEKSYRIPRKYVTTNNSERLHINIWIFGRSRWASLEEVYNRYRWAIQLSIINWKGLLLQKTKIQRYIFILWWHRQTRNSALKSQAETSIPWARHDILVLASSSKTQLSVWRAVTTVTLQPIGCFFYTHQYTGGDCITLNTALRPLPLLHQILL